MKFFFGTTIGHWKLYGVWIANKYYLGFSIVDKRVLEEKRINKVFNKSQE